MTYENQAAGTVHNIKVEMRVASGLAQVTFSSAVGATYPLVKLTSVGAQLNPLTTRLTLAGVDVEIANTEAVQQLMAPGYLVQTSLTDAAGLSDLTLKIRPGGAAALTAALGVFPYGLHIGAESVLVMGAVAGPRRSPGPGAGLRRGWCIRTATSAWWRCMPAMASRPIGTASGLSRCKTASAFTTAPLGAVWATPRY